MSTTRDTHTHGVIVIHGIGSQRQSDTLLDIGGALVDWLIAWHAARSERPPAIARSALDFSPNEDNLPSQRSHATVTFDNGDRWEMAEAWWATAYRHQELGPMALWSLKYLWSTIISLVHALLLRCRDQWGDGASVGPIRRLALTVYTFFTLVLFFIGAIIGLPVVAALLLLAQIPIPQVRAVFITALQPFLEVNLTQFRAICEDELQAANMRRVVKEMVLDLKARGCDDVTIVAHSGGAVISFDMLADPVHANAAVHVRKLITVGSGLNKAWAIARGQELERLLRPPPCHIHWLDLWGTFDPFPQGWLDPFSQGVLHPSRPKTKTASCEVFHPSDNVIAAQGLVQRVNPYPFSGESADATDRAPLRYWPVSVKVTNALSVLADHGGYWQNTEEVLVRLAAEVDAVYYRDSRYWQGYGQAVASPEERKIVGYFAPVEKTVSEMIKRRRTRVIWLAIMRTLSILLWLVSASCFGGVVATWLRAHRSWLPIPTWLAALADSSVGQWLHIVSVASHLAAALVIGIPFLILFALLKWPWSAWNRRAMRAAIRAVATANDPSARANAPGLT